MPKVFLSPYTSNFAASGEGDCAKSFAPLHAALENREWPYDYGDDPSFFCRRKLNSALTWGVCRADVRNQVQPGDVVVFFAFTRLGEQVEYRLSAIATVERKIRQSEVFCNPSYQKYTQYLNLLVRPLDGAGKEWQHYEPGSPEKDWHGDWLSRIVPFRFFSKPELERQAKIHRVSTDSYIDGKQFRFGNNYVLFSQHQEQTFIISDPPRVAHAVPPSAEVWNGDSLSREIYNQTVKEAQPEGVQRTLRIDNKVQQPHSPPIRWKLSESELLSWREKFFKFLLAHDLKRC
jgi:hypothetical protein